MNPNNKEFEEEVLKYREEHGYPEYFQELYNTAAHFYKVALETLRAEVLKEMRQNDDAVEFLYNATRKKDIRFKSQADEDRKIIRFIDKITKRV